MTAGTLRVLSVGEAALTVELGDTIDPEINARVRALDEALAAAPFPGFREAAPTYRALLVHFDPALASPDDVRARLESLARGVPPLPTEGPLHHVPVRYGGEGGPDLADVAAACHMTEAEVVARHSGRDYTAFMLGFTSGFPYLGLLAEELALPRRSTPRVRVPAGSVAIAGRQTGIYPATTPGGWHLIGRTDVRIFDPAADPPTLFRPGDRVRFVPLGDADADADADGDRAQPATTAARRVAPPVDGIDRRGALVVEVLEGGLLTTVQDAGRFGYRRVGVVWAGAMDRPALAAANALVGNAEGAAALECTVTGPSLRFLAPCRFAISGADLGAVLQRSDLGDWPVPLDTAVLARPGNVLGFHGRRSGCRAYVALAGGIDVPPAMGSRSTDLVGGFGGFQGRALAAGDQLAAGPRGVRSEAARRGRRDPDAGPVRVVLGPQDDHFTPEALQTFLSAEFTVQPTSDRVGCRLQGPTVRHRGAAEIASDGMLPGSIQVPPDGQPIVMMADSPATGGYPKIANVIEADLPRLAQLLPGQDAVRFTAVSVEEALAARRGTGAPDDI